MDEKTESKLHELEQTKKEFWNIARESAELIYKYITENNYKNIFEIGTSNGYSTIWLAMAAKQTGGHITSFEFWEKRIVLAEANLEYCSLREYVDIIQGSALDSLKKIDKTNPLDFVLIDANKKEYIKYFEQLHPMLKPGGMFVADNVISHKKSVQEFLDAAENHPDYKTYYVEYDGGLLVGEKIK